MTDSISPLTAEQLEGMIRGWQTNRILLTAVELDVFSHTETPVSSQEVATAIGSAPRHTDRLLHALTALGVLEKRDGRFRNTPVASRHLVPGKPDYWMSLHHLNHMWDSWSRLTDVIRTGKPVRLLSNPPGWEDWAEAFIAAMQQFGSARAPAVIERLDFSGVHRFLDVGGGSGAFSVALARQFPGLDIVIFDLPEILPLTKKYVASSGVDGRISYAPGDFLKDDLGTGFDMILMSNVIHSNGPKDVSHMFRKAFRALNPGGRIVVHDFLPNEDRTAPSWAVLFALNMLVHTENGDTFTLSEITHWLTQAGFTAIRHASTGMQSDLVIGSTPRA